MSAEILKFTGRFRQLPEPWPAKADCSQKYRANANPNQPLCHGEVVNGRHYCRVKDIFCRCTNFFETTACYDSFRRCP